MSTSVKQWTSEQYIDLQSSSDLVQLAFEDWEQAKMLQASSSVASCTEPCITLTFGWTMESLYAQHDIAAFQSYYPKVFQLFLGVGMVHVGDEITADYTLETLETDLYWEGKVVAADKVDGHEIPAGVSSFYRRAICSGVDFTGLAS